MHLVGLSLYVNITGTLQNIYMIINFCEEKCLKLLFFPLLFANSALPSPCKCLLLSHVWLCDPMDCSPPGSSVHGILQARTLEGVAISSSRGSSQPRDWTRVSCIAGDSLPSELPGNPPSPYCPFNRGFVCFLHIFSVYINTHLSIPPLLNLILGKNTNSK